MATEEKYAERARRLLEAGQLEQAEEICRRALAVDLPDDETLELSLVLAESLWRRGLAQPSIEPAQNALVIASRLGLVHSQASALGCLGIAYGDLGDFSKSLEAMHEALDLHTEAGNRQGISSVLGNLGNIYLLTSDLQKALDYYSRALALNEELDKKNGVASNLSNLGSVYHDLGDFPRAQEYYRKALELNEELGRKAGVVVNLNNLGGLYSELKEFRNAIEHYRRALELNQELGRRSGIASNYGNLGIIYQQLGDFSTSMDFHTRALELNTELGNKHSIATNLGNMGTLYSERDYSEYSFDHAVDHLSRAIAIAEEMQAYSVSKSFHSSLASIYKAGGHWEKAYHHLYRFNELQEIIQSEETKKLSDRYAFERQIVLIQKEREITEKANQEIMEAYAKLDAEKERVDALLLNVLPASIVDRIKNGERVIADYFPSVSIFFCDIVGFSEIAGSLRPDVLVQGLNMVITELDKLTRRHGLEKIKTIGDAYMAVSGLPVERADHASAMVAFALDVLDTVQCMEVFPGRAPLTLRIGLHAGPVVAGIIGEHKFSYDLWGDSVNIASRMESTGEAGKIHCTREFRDLAGLLPGCVVEECPMMSIKGKGDMQTYFLYRE